MMRIRAYHDNQAQSHAKLPSTHCTGPTQVTLNTKKHLPDRCLSLPKTPQFCGTENPSDFYVILTVLGVYKFKFKPSYKTCNKLTIQLLLAACLICFKVTYKHAGFIFKTFEILSDQFYWEVHFDLDSS